MAFDQTTQSDGISEKLVAVNRTTKVVKGGRIFGFSAITVVGDGKGRVGIGMGKSREVPQAIQKALQSARRNMHTISFNKKTQTIHYAKKATHGASLVIMKPAKMGTGIIAGGAMRAVFEVAGIKNITAKCLGSPNAINVVKATLSGLTSILSPRQIANKKKNYNIIQEGERSVSNN